MSGPRNVQVIDSPMRQLLHLFFGRYGTTSKWSFVGFLRRARCVCIKPFPPPYVVGLICAEKGFGKSSAINNFKAEMQGVRRIEIITVDPDATKTEASAHIIHTMGGLQHAHPPIEIVFIDELHARNFPVEALEEVQGRHRLTHFVVVTWDHNLEPYAKRHFNWSDYKLMNLGKSKHHGATLRQWSFEQLKGLCAIDCENSFSDQELKNGVIVDEMLPGTALDNWMKLVDATEGRDTPFLTGSMLDNELTFLTAFGRQMRKVWDKVWNTGKKVWNKVWNRA